MLKQKLSQDELRFGLLLHNKMLFLKYFWKEDLTQEPSIRQKMMFTDTSRKVMCCTARKVFKTGKIEAEIIQTAMTKTGPSLEENLFYTPVQSQMTPTRERLISKLNNVPFFSLMLKSINKSDGIVEFKNNLKWHIRIEGDNGQNLVGLRAHYIVGDEGAFSNDEAHRQLQMVALPDCRWLWCGVPNGIRNSPFYRVDQNRETDGKDWHHHHLETYDNPIFNNVDAKEKLIQMYGGTNTQGYITQVLGLWGDEALSAFPLLARVDGRQFVKLELNHEQVNVNTPIQTYEFLLRELIYLSHIPQSYVIAGMDVGYARDPSAIAIYYLEGDIWYLLARIKLYNVMALYQARVLHVMNRLFGYRFACIAMDMSGYGRSIYEALVQQVEFTNQFDYEQIILDAHLQGAWQVGETEEGKPITMPTKEYTTMLLRDGLGKGFEAIGGYEKK